MTNEELVTQIQTGETALLSTLYQQNAGFLQKIAAKMCNYGENEDLLQNGYLGLREAALRYNPHKKVKFLTYAEFWIKNYMRQTETGRITGCISFETPLGEDFTLGDTLADPNDRIRETEDDAAQESGAKELWEEVGKLPPIEAEAIKRHYKNGETFVSIGKSANEAHKRGIKKLRRNKRIKSLCSVYDIAIRKVGVRFFNENWISSVERTVFMIMDQEEREKRTSKDVSKTRSFHGTQTKL